MNIRTEDLLINALPNTAILADGDEAEQCPDATVTGDDNNLPEGEGGRQCPDVTVPTKVEALAASDGAFSLDAHRRELARRRAELDPAR
ncbi:MAG: hypothetical protein AAGN66_25280 [Acidobacteriota bacterium]